MMPMQLMLTDIDPALIGFCATTACCTVIGCAMVVFAGYVREWWRGRGDAS